MYFLRVEMDVLVPLVRASLLKPSGLNIQHFVSHTRWEIVCV